MTNRKTEVERIKHTPEYAAAREALGKVYWENKIGLRDLLFLGGQFLINMRDELGENIDAHGMTKHTFVGELDALVELLVNGIDLDRSFDTAPLGVRPDIGRYLGPALGTGGGHCYYGGPFIIASDPGEELLESGIKNVLINPGYDGKKPAFMENAQEVQKQLSKLFPAVNFVLYNEARGYFASKQNKDAGE